MRLVSLLMVLACLSAADIHKHGVVTPHEVFPDENATIVSFSNGIVFDTRTGEPDLPEKLKIAKSQESDYYLIQLKGPIYKNWIEELKGCGIQVLSYIPYYTLIVHATDEQLSNVGVKSFVQWIGIYQPAYKLEKDLLNANGTGRITVQIFPNENMDEVADQIIERGFEIVRIDDHPLCKTIDIIIDIENVYDIARIPAILWIQCWSEPTFCNYNCQWVTQTGWRATVPSDPGARQIWYNGVTGNGVVLSTTDSGTNTDHQQFYDASNPISSPGVYPNHRKVVAYKLFQGASFGDDPFNSYHGTHVTCTVAGNDTLLGSSSYDGLAKEARIYFTDIANSSGGLVLSQNLTAMYDTIYLGRGLGYHILQHSGSWGWYCSNGAYYIQEASTDAYIWAHRDFLNLYAAGNESSSYRIRNPGMAKNVLTVGATLNGTSSNQIASFSSRGPTQDNRVKPNIMAPGDGLSLWSGLISAYGATTNQYVGMSGTSQAAPSSNGSVGLIRQYLLAGFYPAGAANPADSIKYQSAALLRAMAIVSCDPNVGSWSIPDFNIGWGRIDVDSVLYFTGDTRRLTIIDDTIGVNTGQSITDSFQVNTAIPLRVCMAWTDTAASSGANPTLVNDLHLELVAPSGTYYHGNIYSGGQSSSNPATWDNVNVEECCRINSPESGVWRITVIGQNVPHGPQAFAYAVTGDIGSVVGIEENTRALKPVSQINLPYSIIRNELNLEIILNAPADAQVRIFDLTGRVVHNILDRRLTQGAHIIEEPLSLSSGVYFVQIDAGELQQIEKFLVIR